MKEDMDERTTSKKEKRKVMMQKVRGKWMNEGTVEEEEGEKRAENKGEEGKL